MMSCRAPVGAALAAACLAAGSAAMGDMSHAGLQAREIGAFSEADVAALLAGEGWGFALPAERNGYPGPAHVLDLAGELALTPEQSAAVRAVFDAMSARARTLGAEYVAAEADLDAAFAGRRMDPATLAELTARSEAIRAELRATHLAAHLEVAPLLSPHQIMTYNSLRGYRAGQAAPAGHADHGSH